MAESFLVGDKLSDRMDLDGLQTLLLKGDYDIGKEIDETSVFSSLTEILKFIERIHR